MAILEPTSPYWSGVPEVSDHARQRWSERTDCEDDVLAGWQQAQRLGVGEYDDWSGDEYRVHCEEAVVICRRDTALTTVLNLTGDEAEDWLRSAVYKKFGAVWSDSVGYGGERR